MGRRKEGAKDAAALGVLRPATTRRRRAPGQRELVEKMAATSGDPGTADE